MRRLAPILLASLIFAAPAAAKFEPFAGPRPIAVFIEQNPWLMVIGSDTPRVAYENGDVIFAKKIGASYSLRIDRLSPVQLRELEARWLPILSLPKLKPWYEPSDRTDQATSYFYPRHGEDSVSTAIYGLNCAMAAKANPLLSAELAHLRPEDRPPSAALDLHKMLCAFDAPGSRGWMPRYVEVMFWDYSHAPERSIVLPRQWPSLKSERAIRRGKSRSIFLMELCFLTCANSL